MPLTTSQGPAIWWDSAGTGDPVLLLNGLSSASRAWFRVVPHLTSTHRVITMDNRGVGRSAAPRGRYTVTAMARDAIRVLDAAEVDRAHVVGISMGSAIAQELALLAPERVASLVLAASNPGTRHGKYPSAKVMLLVGTGWLRDYSRFYDSLRPYTYHPSTDPARIQEDIDVARAEHPTRRGLRGQTLGVIGWDRYGDLGRITAPTLVLHGAEDLLDPPANAEILAARIPNAKLSILPQASHQLFTDQEEAAVLEVRDFLSRHPVRTPRGSESDVV